MKNKDKFAKPIVVAVAAVSFSSLTSNQVGAQPVIEEVLVTAQKKTESLQDTPIAVSAFSEAELEDRGIVGATDLQFYVPNLTFGRTVTKAAQVTLRGIGAENINAGGDPGVAVHVDGAYQQYTGYIAQSFLDVERIEVLRGPQGTLYGRNATGGSINIITQKPTEEFEGLAKLGFGNFSQVKAQGVLSGPIFDDVLLGRIAVEAEDREGYISNLFTGDSIDDRDYYSARGQLEWRASDTLTVNLSAYTYDDDSTGVPLVSIADYPTEPLLAGFDLTTFLPVFANFYDINNAGTNVTLNDSRDVRQDTTTEGVEDTDGATLTILKDFETFTLKSVTAYNDTAYNIVGDLDSAAEVTFVQEQTGTYETLTQEILLSSATEGPLEWTAGLYYYKEESFYGIEITFFDTIPLSTPTVGLPAIFSAIGEIEAESFAVFGQFTYALNDSLSLTVGLRSTNDEKDLMETGFAPAFLVFDPATFGPVIVEDSEDWNETTGRLGLEYTTESGNLWYGSISTGFKAGGYNVGGRQSSYDPETVTAYEVGFKSMLAEDRLRLNAAAFFYDYQDLQVFQIEDFQAVIDNAAEAEVYGFELEFLALLSENLQLDGSFSYLHAEYEEFFSVDPANLPAGSQDLSGNRLTRAPEYTVNLGAQYRWGLGNSGSIVARVNASFVDEQYYRPFNLDQARQESFSRTDFSATWVSSDASLEVNGFVKNLENEDVATNIIVASSAIGSLPLASFGQPRTYGVAISKFF